MLTAAELSAMRTTINSSLQGTVDIWRNPAASGGTVGALAIAQGTILASVVPAPSADGRYGDLIPPAPGLSGGRVEWIAVLPHGTDVRVGDELRSQADSTRFKVHGVGKHDTAITCALSEVRA